jgi:hypothetical protein
MIREAKRVDLEYKRSAVAELTRYLNAFSAVNLFDAVKEIVEEGLSLLNEDDDDLQMKPVYVIYIRPLIVVDLCCEQTYTLLPSPVFNLSSTRIEPKTQIGFYSCLVRKSRLPQYGQLELPFAKPLQHSSKSALPSLIWPSLKKPWLHFGRV